MSFFVAMGQVLLALAPWVLLGAAVAGALHVLLPRDFVPRHLGGRRGSVLKAVALGVPLPLCSCGVIPTGLGLRKDGATSGAAVGFLISTPQTGVDSVLVSAAFLGWPFALFKVAAAAVTGIIGGVWTDRADTDTAVPEAQTATAAPADDAPAPRPTVGAMLKDAWEHGVDVLRNIWGWLAIGVVVSAVLTAAVPPSAFSALTSFGALPAMLLVLAISVPLYVCATASVPIAAALVAGGFPPGAALVFLMAGPATNLATMGAVHRTLGRRASVIYLSTIVVGSLLAGLLFDFVVPLQTIAAHAHATHSAPFEIASVVVLLAAFARFGWETLASRWPPRHPVDAPVVELAVDGMTCGGCARKLTNALLATDGVTAATVDHDAGRAQVHGGAPLDALLATVHAAGYTTPDHAAAVPHPAGA